MLLVGFIIRITKLFFSPVRIYGPAERNSKTLINGSIRSCSLELEGGIKTILKEISRDKQD